MDTNPKYIVWYDLNETECFSIFPGFIRHTTMGDFIGRGTIISAGFINNWFECYGESIGLNKKSRVEKDTALVRKQFNYKSE